ncbi:nitrilase-related carbon-nitrogen hydrolase [Zhaonella formicivorans]|uniref:nitrilase-related carbon-nitrogen hydrolase n=1 Tax=Zhaonella formicivorans TaxID=2528593 RepID=UPI0010CF497B|nr:nitrilase-related carbon-nitrogen hydrolase [Zhaonella formicivorans]
MRFKVANGGIKPGDKLENVQRRVLKLATNGVKLVLLPGLAGLCLQSNSTSKPAHCFKEMLLGHRQELPKLNACFLDFCSRLAKEAAIYLACGTVLEPAGEGFRHQAHLFGPDGTHLGEQAQTHCSRTEQTWPLAPSHSLRVFETPLGKIGFVVGSDVFFPEVSRILALQGADLVLAPAAIPAPYNPWRQVSAMWQEVQQNQFFSLENWLNSSFWGVQFQGRAPILGPCEITPEETGYYTCGEGPEQIVELDFTALQKIRREYPLRSHLNAGLYAKFLPKKYAES